MSTSSHDYPKLATDAIGAALSSGLAPGNPVIIQLSVDTPFSAAPLSKLDIIVTADNSQPTFYKKGILWLVSLPGSPYNRLFRTCTTSKPDQPSWYPLTSIDEVIDPTLRISNSDYISKQIKELGPSSVSITGVVLGSLPSYNPITSLYEPTTSPSHLDLDGGTF